MELCGCGVASVRVEPVTVRVAAASLPDLARTLAEAAEALEALAAREEQQGPRLRLVHEA